MNEPVQEGFTSSWAREHQFMVMPLVRLLHSRFCWADKEDICRAIGELNSDLEDHLREMEHLYPRHSVTGSTNKKPR